MSDVVDCPAEDCDYDGLPSSVGGHWQAKTDGLHPGGRQRCMELLSSSGGSASASEPEAGSSSPASEDREERDAGSQRADASNPTMGSAPAEKPPQTGTEASQNASGQQAPQQSQQQGGMTEAGGEPVCPDCGGELWDFRRFSDGQYHRVNGHSVFVRGDYQCDSCTRWWMDE